MNARVRLESNGFGTDIDARRDLGIPNTGFPAGNFEWRRGRSRLRFDYTPIDYSGDQTVTRIIAYGGREYTVGTRVVSGLDVRHLQLGWSYALIDIGEGVFRLGPMAEVNGFLVRGALSAPDLGPSFQSSQDFPVGIPTVGALMTVRPHRNVELYGQMAGMKVGYFGAFTGSDAGVKVRPWSVVLLTAGYRTFNLSVTVAPHFAHLRLGGPFVGAGFRF